MPRYNPGGGAREPVPRDRPISGKQARPGALALPRRARTGLRRDLRVDGGASCGDSIASRQAPLFTWPVEISDMMLRMSKLIVLFLSALFLISAADLPSRKYLNLAAIKTMV